MTRFLTILTMLFAITVQAEVVGREVSYQGDGITMKGYLTWDDNIQGKRPGVLVVHEWWGHNQYARDRAKQLAALGYTALAVDMYGQGRHTSHPDQAGEYMQAAMAKAEGMKNRFMAAMRTLQADPHTDADEIAAIGYCFGGAVVLNMAKAGVDLEGVVSFHGSLASVFPAKKGDVEAKVLAFNGAEDTLVTPEQIDSFKKEMDAADVDYQFVNYPGVKHSFTNPAADQLAEETGLPLGYDAAADQDSWQQMQGFFKAIFD